MARRQFPKKLRSIINLGLPCRNYIVTFLSYAKKAFTNADVNLETTIDY